MSSQPRQVPSNLDPQSPIARSWNLPLYNVAEVDLRTAAPGLADPVMVERHHIYCGLLMALIQRFWNGNNKGPVGIYPWREAQVEGSWADRPEFFRYRGDRVPQPDGNRVGWDRYLGHNIACLAVDGKGEIIDFDFNHNNVFRSSAEHAESRIVRRLFSLTNIFDTWNTGPRVPGKSAAFSLQDVTIYTSLESCAQCSGVMALGRVKRVVFLQSDPGQYRIGNIMFNLAGMDNSRPPAPVATLPIPVSVLGLPCMARLEDAYAYFAAKVVAASKAQDLGQAYFVPADRSRPVEYDSSITSFLCTDRAYDIFADGAEAFSDMKADPSLPKPAAAAEAWSNDTCLEHAREFFDYADKEGYRGSPHKL